ncbi:MAG: hypothetical protein GX483_04720 [Actinomycetaceae bacterium]|nr:hypothetical protein [Actinomycetaceae bacterium]
MENRGRQPTHPDVYIETKVREFIIRNGRFPTRDELTAQYKVGAARAQRALNEVRSHYPNPSAARYHALAYLLDVTPKESTHKLLKLLREERPEELADNELRALLALHGLAPSWIESANSREMLKYYLGARETRGFLASVGLISEDEVDLFSRDNYEQADFSTGPQVTN